MECEGEEESGEMFSPNESGEYMPPKDVVSFTVQGLRDALTVAESMVTEPLHPMDEYIIQLEVVMADWPVDHITSLLMECRHGTACAEE